MPIMRCKLPNGKLGWKFGQSGKCFPTRKQAVKQGQAIKINQANGKIDRSEQLLKEISRTLN